jgi:hypothetical protein
MVDSLDPAEIELWFADRAFNIHRLERDEDFGSREIPQSAFF